MPLVYDSNQCPFHYGWDHFWCDPKHVSNLKIKEFIKGPFVKPNLVCSVPFVTRCQQYGIPVEFRKGIPDYWEEYLAQKLNFFRKHLRNNDLMHKENIDVISRLRKFRNYIGQGIPDPWAAYPYATKIPYYRKGTGHRKNKKGRCLCCEREYLFECPDKCASNTNNCSCKDCHEKNLIGSDSIEKCRCSEIFYNWILENRGLNRRKHKTGNSGDGISSQNDLNSETEDEIRHLKERNRFAAFCECLRNRKGYECGVSENSGPESGDPEANEKTCVFGSRNHGFLKHRARVYFCPCIKNSYGRKVLERDNKILGEHKKSVSKEIQAEILPVKSSKIVQTEKPEKKAQPKCTCHNKCFSCNLPHNNSWEKRGCTTIHTIPNYYCTSRFTQGPAFVCPYSFANCFVTRQQCNETGEIKKHHKKKIHLKERENEEGPSIELRRDQEKTVTDNLMNKSKQSDSLEEQEQKEAQYNLKCNKLIYNSRTSSTAADHLKYLADCKLKGYLQQEEVSPVISNKFTYQNSSTGSKFINFFRGNLSLNGLRQEVPLERFKHFSYYKPRYSESSFAESKINLGQSSIFTSNSRFNYCDQATMTTEAENLESDAIIKENVCKEILGREPEASCFLRNREITKVLGKRRKLLRNRKRRKKLSTSVLGYQHSLTDASKHWK